jgi:hypothetical protein
MWYAAVSMEAPNPPPNPAPDASPAPAIPVEVAKDWQNPPDDALTN